MTTWKRLNKRVPSKERLYARQLFFFLPCVRKPAPYEWALRKYIDEKIPKKNIYKNIYLEYQHFMALHGILKNAPLKVEGDILFDQKIKLKKCYS